ncbi:unnamed protein product [Soboliphyme baturini]|uniref:Secreted peptide n=1 Tax=Soboliphyme baturini TaxID=241478 RepID=A0A183J511_9BILA|nr:unnamed protein product [Soboliphyme baturini]
MLVATVLLMLTSLVLVASQLTGSGTVAVLKSTLNSVLLRTVCRYLRFADLPAIVGLLPTDAPHGHSHRTTEVTNRAPIAPLRGRHVRLNHHHCCN